MHSLCSCARFRSRPFPEGPSHSLIQEQPGCPLPLIEATERQRVRFVHHYHVSTLQCCRAGHVRRKVQLSDLAFKAGRLALAPCRSNLLKFGGPDTRGAALIVMRPEVGRAGESLGHCCVAGRCLHRLGSSAAYLAPCSFPPSCLCGGPLYILRQRDGDPRRLSK